MLMARIFWVTCPVCENKFYAQHDDFRGTERKMQCFSCGNRFTDKQAKNLKD
jgi:predicted Zn finger-like uncharacterized protein